MRRPDTPDDIDGNKYLGKVCSTHPEMHGLRYKKNYNCVQCHKDRARAKQDSNREAHLQKMRDNAKARHARLKIEVLQAYGGKCEKCEVCDPDMLTIDHIDGTGAEHRKQLAGVARSVYSIGSNVVYRWLRDNGFPSGFRVLCFNHNIKEHLLKVRAKNEHVS